MKIFAKAALNKDMTLTIPLTDDNVFIVCPDCGEELSFPLESYLTQRIMLHADDVEPDSDYDEVMNMIDTITDTLKEIHEILTQVDDNHENQ